MIPAKIGTAFSFPLGPFVSSTDGYTVMSALAIGTTNVRLCKNGGAFLSKSTATTPAYAELGFFSVTFTATDLETQGHTRVGVAMTSAGGALPVWEDFWVSETSELAVALSTAGKNNVTTSVWAEALASHTTAGGAGQYIVTNLLSPTSGVTMLAASQTSLVTAVTTSVWAEILTSHSTASGAGNALRLNLLSPTSGVTMLAASQTALVTAMTTAMWAEALAGHTTAGGAGKKLSDIVLTTTPDPLGVAVPGAYGGGTVGNLIGNNLLSATTAASLSAAGVLAVTTSVWGELLASHTTAGGVGAALTAIKGATTTLPATPASSTDAMRLHTTAIDLIWDEAMADHLAVGSVGAALNAAGGAGDPWIVPLPGAYTTAQAGGLIPNKLNAIVAGTTTLPATPASSTSFLNWAMSTDMGTALTALVAIEAATTTLPLTPASSTDAMRLATTAIDLIWDEALAGHGTTATAGERLSAAATTAASAAASTDMASALTALTAIQAATTTLPLAPAGSSNFTTLMTSTGSTAMADAVWNVISESTQSYAEQIRNMRSALAGKATGGGTAAISFRDVADTINRLTFTATTDGNRTAVVIVTT